MVGKYVKPFDIKGRGGRNPKISSWAYIGPPSLNVPAKPCQTLFARYIEGSEYRAAIGL